MEIKEVYQYLEAIDKIDCIINNKQAEMESILNIGTSTTQNLSGMPHASGTSDKVANAAVRMIALQEEINSDIDFLYDYKCEVIKNIEKLDSKSYDVLHRYYVQGHSLGRIADYYADKYKKAFFSRQAVSNIKKKAVYKLSKIVIKSEKYNELKKKGFFIYN